MATLTIPPVLSSPRDDAMHLYKAFKGLGCDTSAVVNILAHRDSAQRALIIHDYKIMYSEDPIKRLTSELGGDLKKAILLWMPDPARRDAIILQDALTTDIDLKAATEVICSRTPSQLQHLKQIYPSLHGVYKHLEDAIQAQTSGDLGQLLLAYLSTPRSEGLEVDRTMVDHDAKALYKAGEKRLGTDEKTFRIIFSGRSRAHLAAVSSAYHNMYGNTLKKAVKGETSGNYEHALVTILQCAENPGKYFAKVLRKAMKGMGTDDKTLIRVIVTRTEIDMQYIKAEYHKKHHKSLNDAVHSETSGHYQTFLLSLLGPNHH
ncbi:annexin D5-like isoform X1 [Cynara cardunculus var. scolymus]|uniref:annexin D5-like isoform X1 n=2 Tax=Cynara cardunculus var. scolymus TaxID=59895 RepID=UPI000D62FAB5|nr:annexin D5-like isoform X1 [Cynara cardunculus var. scolymus]